MHDGLRFDKVAVRLIEQISAGLEPSVPKGALVLFTVTAPIRLPAKTATELERRIHDMLQGSPRNRSISGSINGNLVSACVLRAKLKLRTHAIGFVHNPDVDPAGLVALTESVLQNRSQMADDRTVNYIRRAVLST